MLSSFLRGIFVVEARYEGWKVRRKDAAKILWVFLHLLASQTLTRFFYFE